MNPESGPAPEPDFFNTCFRCGECCTRYQVLLDREEMERVAGFLGISVRCLISDYTDFRWPVPGKFLLRHRDNGGCIFLVHQGKEALCSVHVAKPNACRDWAPGRSRKECSQGLARVWGLVATEEGDLCGPEHNRQAFLEYLRSIAT
jgi:Fe-S-cluster containining protein